MKRIDKDSKIAVAIHTYGPIDPDVYFAHMGLMRSWSARYNILFCGIDRHRTADARNILVETARANGCTHYFSLDADHIIPDHALDVLQTNDDVMIASGLICKRKAPYGQVGFVKLEDGYHQVCLPVDGRSYMVNMPAMGCTLFDIDVFDKLEEPWFYDSCVANAEGKLYNKRSDSNFFANCEDAGIKMCIDTRVVCGHVGSPEIVYPGQKLNTAKMNQDNTIRMDADSKKYQALVYEKACELVAFRRLKNVLDLGCGNPIKLKPIAEDVDLVGVDYPVKIADISRRGVKGTWIGEDLNHHFDLGRKFDLIIAADVIEHLDTVTTFFEIVHTHLAKGGTLILSTPDKSTTSGTNVLHAQEFTDNEIVGILGAHGFSCELSKYDEIHGDKKYTNQLLVCKRQEK